uniref:Uncharacterized protein n=1 Tax=Romanomermis culicivorax TaxID=13658 RepID=A0A915HX21_ROMCU
MLLLPRLNLRVFRNNRKFRNDVRACLSKNEKLPANGEPINEAIPINKSNKPKALVNFSKPNNCTHMIEHNFIIDKSIFTPNVKSASQ